MPTFRLTTRLLTCTTLILLLTVCFNKKQKAIAPAIIPIPQEQIIKNGVFSLSKNTYLESENTFKSVSNYFNSFLKTTQNISLKSEGNSNKISFIKNNDLKNEEGYFLNISDKQIKIEAKTEKGAFYAVQSLIQLLPIENNGKEIDIQCLEIKDTPQFSYRGMHLDVGRHFFSVDFIKKYLDLMALLKMNTFHWHLTEDQGWRIEIKKYPKLQEIAAFRDETLIGHYNDTPQKFDGKKYGGFYTQEEIKDIIKYALERQITVIPEIEMPGHSQAAIAAYPRLSCTGRQVEVATKWGVFEEIYCPSETTFQFLEDVIDEVVALFPGKYIHIGGDEAPKTRWKNCKHCQALIKRENLKDENGLQSYFIKRMEKYINQKGKQIIGWDEILEGGLAPNATVMSWRGTTGAIEAAKEKHNVILTPNSHCYFDYYQSEDENEPMAIGGFLPLEKVYNFNPIPKELTTEQQKYVLGAQGNVWTEYMPTEDKVEYMAFPRMMALSEVVWSSTKNYSDFKNRLLNFHKRLDALSVNYANHLFEISGNISSDEVKTTYTLKSDEKNAEIRYTTNGIEPDETSLAYNKPIEITGNTTIKAASFLEDKKISSTFIKTIELHKAVGQKITLKTPPNKAYNTGGKQALINGISGSNKRYGDKEWLGWSGEDVEITIEFDKPTEINSISTRFHNGNGQWIYAPKSMAARITLEKGDVIANKFMIPYERKKNTIPVVLKFKTQSQMVAKKIKLIIPNYGIIPDGKQGAGHKAWTFIDEIIIE